jgi:hypothetical protein
MLTKTSEVLTRNQAYQSRSRLNLRGLHTVEACRCYSGLEFVEKWATCFIHSITVMFSLAPVVTSVTGSLVLAADCSIVNSFPIPVVGCNGGVRNPVGDGLANGLCLMFRRKTIPPMRWKLLAYLPRLNRSSSHFTQSTYPKLSGSGGTLASPSFILWRSKCFE